MELEQIWEEALKMIEEETSPVSFATWIQPIVPCGIIGNKIILQVKESFLKEIIEKRHLPLIRTAIKMVTKNEYDIMITTEEEQKAGNLHNLAAEKPAENELARNRTRNMYSIPLLSATATVWRMPHPLPLRNLRHRRIIPCFYTAIPGLAKRT